MVHVFTQLSAKYINNGQYMLYIAYLKCFTGYVDDEEVNPFLLMRL